MKKLVFTAICLIVLFNNISAQQRSPQTVPDKSEEPTKSDDPFRQQQGQQLQKMFGGSNFLQKMFGDSTRNRMSDSTQNFGFQEFKMPFGESNGQSFGFSFDGNGWKLLTPDNDSTSANGMRELQERMKQMMPNFNAQSPFSEFFGDFDKFFQGKMPFPNNDPSVVPPMDKQKPKSNKKYETERL
jgi:hypothetical protein